MRHAKSDWHSHLADIDRPLNDRGQADAVRMGKYIKGMGLVPEKIIVSAARRTQQTCELIVEVIGVQTDNIHVDKDLYLADKQTLIENIEAYAKGHQRIMVIAHNPGMDDLVRYFSDQSPPLTDSGKLMTTCAIACFYFNSLSDILMPGKGKLLRLLRPKEI